MGSDGLLHTAAVNEPRYEYDSLGNYLGLLIEEQRTNIFAYSGDPTQTPWQYGSAGIGSAPVKTPNYALAPDGSMTACRVQLALNGSTSANDYSYVVRAALTVVPSTTYFLSVWFKATDPANVGKVIGMRGVAGGGYLPITLTADWKRVGRGEITGAGTTSINSTLAILRGGGTIVGGSDSADFLMWEPQLEGGAFATSNIQTTSAAATRSADVAQITDLTKIGFNSAAGTLLATIDSASPNDNTTRAAAALGGNARLLYENSGAVLIYNGVSSASRAKPAAGTIFKVATSYGSRVAVATAGVAFSNVSAVGMAGSTLAIGGLTPGGNVWCGHIQRLTYLPRQLPDAELARNAP
jgi:hypothetical protein